MYIALQVFFFLSAIACSSTSYQQILASNPREVKYVVQSGEGYRHLLIQQAGDSNLLHVYIEGDGRPWLTPRRISLDPTPEKLLMLQLMLKDPANAVYIGRPCYFRVKDDQCSPRLWTSERYSQAVISSMNSIIDGRAKNFSGVALLGHSGGGTLAMLLAARRNDVKSVLTLGSNLDTNAWVQHHGYSPLVGSLNPRDDAPLPATVKQTHFFAELDEICPKSISEKTLAKQRSPVVKIVPGFNHGCCWGALSQQIYSAL